MRKTLFYFIIVFIFSFFSFFTIKTFIVKKKDMDKYDKIIKRKSKLTSCKKLKRKPIYQKRENVEKDIFIIEDDFRKHIKLISTNSNIFVKEQNKKMTLIEDLENIKCISQDNVYFSKEKNCFMQKIRFFSAKKGKYLYPSHKFSTDSINLKFFEIPGSKLPTNINSYDPYLNGSAKDLSFSIKEKNLNLNAKHFRALVDTEKTLN